jgi:hypothetical protein
MTRLVRTSGAALAFVAAALILSACTESATRTGGPMGPGPSLGQPSLTVVTGTSFQLAVTDIETPPIRVRVVDEQGRAVRSAWVRYEVLTGQGFFSADSTLTNDQGVTEVRFRPLSTGTVVAQASVSLPGGSSQQMITFNVLHDPDLATGLERVGGDDQSGTIGSVLAQPFVVRVTNPDGFPVDGFPVTFAMISPDSIAMMVDPATGDEDFQVTVLTGEDGLARAFMRMGSRPGVYSATASALFGTEGAQTVRTATFAATATLPPGAATRLVAIAGDRQTVTIGFGDSLDPTDFTPFLNPEQPNPLGVQALDRFGNPVPGVQVFWNVTDGGGAMFTFTTFTDQNGITLNNITNVTLGRNLVDAVAATTNRVTFVIEAISSAKDEEERPGPGESGPGKEGTGNTPVN